MCCGVVRFQGSLAIAQWLRIQPLGGGTPIIIKVTGVLVITFRGQKCGFGTSQGVQFQKVVSCSFHGTIKDRNRVEIYDNSF